MLYFWKGYLIFNDIGHSGFQPWYSKFDLTAFRAPVLIRKYYVMRLTDWSVSGGALSCYCASRQYSTSSATSRWTVCWRAFWSFFSLIYNVIIGYTYFVLFFRIVVFFHRCLFSSPYLQCRLFLPRTWFFCRSLSLCLFIVANPALFIYKFKETN